MRNKAVNEEPQIPDRFVVEADKRVVGVAIRVPGGFKFFASDTAFQEAEARVFPRAKAMARRIADIARRRRGEPDGVQPPAALQ
ncbi:hypothetical protein E2493_12510 [Sphingomonas parva]|uniref:Uncharacterized protein n=1 Tax=Sphingomonas parva TaxID=2555898 RepID=A0A4Y8ZPR8_9SPHN|nr:hypothetical protein [Sphingomonas parva]TFI58010.1 hypothetical protein E2493_12510 [Sphingomonas parva]